MLRIPSRLKGKSEKNFFDFESCKYSVLLVRMHWLLTLRRQMIKGNPGTIPRAPNSLWLLWLGARQNQDFQSDNPLSCQACLRQSAPIKGPQGPKATSAHLFFFWLWQTKKTLVRPSLYLPMASSSIGKKSHILGTQSPPCTNAGGLGCMVQNLCTQSQPRALL